MGDHPNVVLLCTLTPDDLARKTLRDIKAEYPSGRSYDGDEVKVAKLGLFAVMVLESCYSETYQLGGREGDILVFRHMTYDYGEQIAWDVLAIAARELEEWAVAVCQKHHCNYKISVTADYR